MAFNVTLPGIRDIRQPVLGDSYNWYGLEPLAAKKSIVVHHSASPNNQDGFDISAHHVNNNNWGGIGYHFIVTHDDYHGRSQFGLPAGAQVQYVGDLETYRAHVANGNPGRIGICLVGNFVDGVPGPKQLALTRALIDHLLLKTPELSSLKYHSQVIGHGQIQGQSTACPGYANPLFTQWMAHLKNGAFPHSLYGGPTGSMRLPDPAPVSVVTTPPPAPVTEVVTEAGKGGGEPEFYETPEGITNKRDQTEKRSVLRAGAMAINVETGAKVADIPVGTLVDIGGYFDHDGHSYARTVYSTTNNKWNGIDVSVFDEPTGQTEGAVPITHVEVPTVTENPVVIPDPTTKVEVKEAGFKDYLLESLAKLAASVIKIFTLKFNKKDS